MRWLLVIHIAFAGTSEPPPTQDEAWFPWSKHDTEQRCEIAGRTLHHQFLHDSGDWVWWECREVWEG